MDGDQAPDTPADDGYRPVDIFAWANNLQQHKKDLRVELFLINRNNVLYSTKLSEELQKQLVSLFISGAAGFVNEGAAEGLVVRGFEDAEEEENVLQRTRWENVEKLSEVLYWINTQESEIQQFSDEEHDLKRLKGVLARCTYPGSDEPFYAIKALPRAQLMKGEGSWIVKGKLFSPMNDEVALKVPADNQLLVIEEDLFVFNQGKLKSLFSYDAKKNSIAEKKVLAILEQYKLVFPEGEDMQTMVKGNKQLINKLQNLEVTGEIKQDDLVDHGAELGVDMMTDDQGAIIIENTKELVKFVNLLNDDYVESALTGQRYEIRSKRPLKLKTDDDAAL